MPSLNFKGKTFVQHHHLAVRYHQLVPRPDLSLTDRHSLQSDNLILRGDNLLALKALLPTYAGQIKCIYIDPPYNTGNEGWAYNDNVNSPMIQAWLKEKVVDKEDLTRHDKWCCMMFPRLKLLHELLAEDGAIFISIDDNEQHRLRLILDEIFGEENFVANVIWEKSDSPKMDSEFFSHSHDHLIVYAKHADSFKLNRLESDESEQEHFTKTDADGRRYYLKPLRAMGGDDYRAARPGLFFPLLAPNQLEIFPRKKDGSDGRWRWNKDKIEKERERIEWVEGKNGWNPYFRIYADSVRAKPSQTIWYHEDVGSNRTSKIEINSILGETNTFDTPKPVRLIKRILEIATDENSIVLDSFAGSGTTAQAVLEMNQADGGNRRFILVEMEDYAEKITAERVRRVIKGVPGAKKEALRAGLGGTFSYFELGDEIEYNQFLTRADTYPAWEELARFVFFTATGEQLDLTKCDPARNYVGESLRHVVWLFYQPDHVWLRTHGFTLAQAEDLPRAPEGKRNLVFAPMKYVDDDSLYWLRVDYLQLPYEIYRMK